MIIDSSVHGELKINMSDYIKEVISKLPKDMNGKSETPGAKHLFKINEENSVKLKEEQAEFFHHVIMELIYLSQWGHSDIRTVTSFLSLQVACPLQKLMKVMKYLQHTIDLCL